MQYHFGFFLTFLTVQNSKFGFRTVEEDLNGRVWKECPSDAANSVGTSHALNEKFLVNSFQSDLLILSDVPKPSDFLY